MKKGTLSDKQKMYVIVAAVAAAIVFILIIYFAFFNENTKLTSDPSLVSDEYKFLLEAESTELENFDMYEAQDIFMKEILSYYKKGKYTLDNPLVLENPFILSPQSALIMFKTETSEKITVTLKGKHNDDLVTTFEASKDHYLPIYGLYGKHKNEIILTSESGKSKTVFIDIKEKVEAAPVEVLENKIPNSNGQFYFTTSSLGAATMAYDNYGEVRWWLDIGYTKGMTMLQNGNILISDDSPGPESTSTGGVVEVDMMGFVRREYHVDGGYHHDGYEMENGNLLILTSDTKNGTFADYIVELDRKTGKVVKDWSLKKICDAIDPTVSNFYPTWGWINSITYDKKTNALILSVRNQNSVVSIDYDTSKINWILGNKKYWTSKYDPYLIKGVGEDFIYPSGQHSVNITKEGYLSIFNNGYDAHDEHAVSCKSLRNNESYAMLYKLDLDKREAEVVWKYGGKEYFSYALSSFTYASDGHRIFNSGWHFTDKVNYNDKSCTQFSNDLYDSYLIEFDESNNIVVKLHILESKFEVVKAPIYNLGKESSKPNNDTVFSNYGAKKAPRLSTGEKKYIKLKKEEVLKYAVNKKYDLALYINKGQIGTNSIVREDETVSVILINLQGDAYKFVLKEAGVNYFVEGNLYSLPKGRYYIYADFNGEIYNTLQHVEI